jgi:hypothetical protein
MTTTHNIPAGYQLHVTTWENDADDYNTKITNGLGMGSILFLVALAKKFKSKHNHKEKGLGNDSTTRDQLVDAIKSALAVSAPSTEMMSVIERLIAPAVEDDEDDVSGYYIHEWLCETLLGYAANEIYRYEYSNFCRVYQSHQVFYFPLECMNVSEQFQ